jgi:hypothetical protein
LNLERAAHRLGIAMKHILPRNPADENYVIPARLRLFRKKRAAQHWSYTQDGEEL